MVVFVRSQEQLCGGLTGGKDGGESSSRDMLFTAALFPSASASGGGGGGHLTWRLPVVPTVDGLFTHFIWQTLFQSVRPSVIRAAAATAATAILLRPYVVYLSPQTRNGIGRRTREQGTDGDGGGEARERGFEGGWGIRGWGKVS